MKIKILFIALCFTQLSLASFLRDTARGVSWSKEIYADIMIQPQEENVSLAFKNGPHKSYVIIEFLTKQSHGQTKHRPMILPPRNQSQTKQQEELIVVEYERCMRIASAALKPKHKKLKSIFVQILDDQTAQLIE